MKYLEIPQDTLLNHALLVKYKLESSVSPVGGEAGTFIYSAPNLPQPTWLGESPE